MQLNKGSYVALESIHFFNHEDFFESTQSSKLRKTRIVTNNNQLYYLIKKGEEYDINTKYSYLNYIEKSFSLIHPALINISGFSTEKAYLYYQYTENHHSFDEIRLTDINVQKIFIGLASGLLYLLEKGYYYPNFSIKTIIFDIKICPKMIDYINLGDSNKGSEKDLIIKYVDIMKYIIDKKRNQENESTVILNEELNSLIERCANNSNIPTFSEFIQFFRTKSAFKCEEDIYRLPSFTRYLDVLNLRDKITFDDIQSLFSKDEIENFTTIEQVCFYFFRKRNNDEKLNDDDLFLLNSLPEYYIKPLVKFINPLKDKLIRYLYNEDISMIISNWNNICEKNAKDNPFSIYKILNKKMKSLEKEKNEILYFNKKRKDIDYKIDALRIQAIHFLKEASKQKLVEAQIELAVQYIKGYLLPYNIQKASEKLDEIDLNSDKINNETKALVNQMKISINDKKNEISTKNIIKNLNENQRSFFERAQQGHILSMLYVGFAFYTGLNKFPVVHSLSIYFYKKAASISADAMALLGYLYFRGIFFPHNLKKARKYFKLAAENGCVKAEIIDSIIRRHVWRSYLVDFDISELFSYYLQSVTPNDAYQFVKIIYYLENHMYKDYIFKLILKREDDNSKLLSDKSFTNRSIYVLAQMTSKWDNKIKNEISDRILLTSNNIENTDDVKTLKYLADSYYYGNDDFPVNYKKAICFYKMAADRNDSESAWKYALLCYNSICGSKSDIDFYFRESTRLNSMKGMYYYILFLKQERFNKKQKENETANQNKKTTKNEKPNQNKKQTTNKKPTTNKTPNQNKKPSANETSNQNKKPTTNEISNQNEEPSADENPNQNKIDNINNDFIEVEVDDEESYSDSAFLIEDGKDVLSDNLNFGKNEIINDDNYIKRVSVRDFNVPKRNNKTLQNENLYMQFLYDLAQSKDLNAMYHYAMFQEDNDTRCRLSVKYYRKGAKRGHFNSLIRLNNLYRLYYPHIVIENFFLYSLGIFNEKYLVKAINYYDDNKNYDQSNIIIQIGIRLNPPLFNMYFGDHLLYGKGVEKNIQRAKKLALLALNENYQFFYKEKYIYLMLQVLVINGEYKKALLFLFENKKILKYKHSRLFHEFYKRFPRNLAQEYFIPACFCCEDYKICHDVLMAYHDGEINLMSTFNEILKFAKECNNPFAMAVLGKAYKMGKYIIRDLESSIQYSARSAELKCPLGHYYIGKEYLFGRYLDKNYKKALKQFELAIANNAEPRAGYYIFLISEHLNDHNIKNFEKLQIAAEFKHKRSLCAIGLLYFYGDKYNRVEINKDKGKKLIMEAALQGYKKAKHFCFKHMIKEWLFKKPILENSESENHQEHKMANSNLKIIKEDSELSLVDLEEEPNNSNIILPIKHDKSSESCSLSSSLNFDNNNDNKNTELLSSVKNKSVINQAKILKKDSDLSTEQEEEDSDLSIKGDEESVSELFNFWF